MSADVETQSRPNRLRWLLINIGLPVLVSILTASVFLVPAITDAIVKGTLLSALPSGTIILATQNAGGECPRGFQNKDSAGLQVNPVSASANEQIVLINHDRNTDSKVLWPLLCIKP